MMLHAARLPLPIATLAAVIFLAVQVVWGVVHAFSDSRLFFYTPYSGQTAFRLNVSADGQIQTTAQVRARYHLSFRGRTDLTPEALQRIVVHHETKYARDAEPYVRLHFSRQRGPEEIWLWPQQ